MHHRFYSPGMMLKMMIIFFIALQLISTTAKSQMRQVYEDIVESNKIYKISFYSPSEGYVAFSDWIGYTADSGRTFTKKFITLGNVDFGTYSVNITFGFSIEGVKAFNHNTIIVYGDYGLVPAILYSNNGGNSFTLIYHSQYNPNQLRTGILDMIFPQNSNVGYAVDADRILKTINGGLSWSAVRTDPASYFTNLEAPDDNTVFAFSVNTYKVLRTTNAGTNWQAITLPVVPQGILNYAYFLTANTGWVAMYDDQARGYIYKTTNGGANWTLQNNLEVTSFSSSKMKFIDNNIGYALHDDYSIFKTEDGGMIWEPLPRDNNYTYLSFSHTDLHFYSNNQFWAGGRHGFLEITTNGGGTPIPQAYFKIDTAGLAITGNVNLVNYSRTEYTYQWYVNDNLVSTNYNTSYVHDLFYYADVIKLVVSNGISSDTLQRIQNFGPAPAPHITGFTPTSGTVGSTIAITGTNLLTTTAVRIGTASATAFQILTSTTVTAVIGNTFSGRVRITTTGGADSLSGFTFIPPPPSINSFTPTSALPGTLITITGNYFDATSTLSFGGVPAVSFTVISRTQINAIVGYGASGDVLITTATGSASRAGFNFVPLPTISSFSPLSGPIGTIVTIYGANFSPLIADNIVYFGGVKANVIDAGPTSLKVQVPPGATYLPIAVSSDGRTCYSNSPFVVTFADSGPFTADAFPIVGKYNTTHNDVMSGCISDIDGDGKLDIITSNTAGTSSISVFRNTSVGNNITFSRVTLFSGSLPTTVAVKDLNADGKPDIIIGTGFQIQVAKNTSTPGNISFAALQSYAGSGAANGLFIDDIDKDNRPDIIKGVLADRIIVYRNTSVNGNLSFDVVTVFTPSENAFGSILADLDGDDRPELISTGSGFSVFRNLSSPGLIQFGPRIFTAFDGTRGAAAGDFDGDGKIDLAFAHPFVGGHTIGVFRNTSTGPGNFSFDPVLNCPTYAPYSVQIADIDGDGKADLSSANEGENRVSLYKNTSSPGTLSFAPRIFLSTGSDAYPQSAPLGDFDGDGKPDVAYINFNYNGFSIGIFKNKIGPNVYQACINGNITLTADTTGVTYQWQQNTGNGFNNISDNANFSGTSTSSLQITNFSSSWYGYQFRCVINAKNRDMIEIRFRNFWTGGSDNQWNNPANWSCGTVPDNNTDVIINSGAIVLNSNTAIRTLTVSPAVNLTIDPGYTLTITH